MNGLPETLPKTVGPDVQLAPGTVMRSPPRNGAESFSRPPTADGIDGADVLFPSNIMGSGMECRETTMVLPYLATSARRAASL
jgi:hypothetical protein